MTPTCGCKVACVLRREVRQPDSVSASAEHLFQSLLNRFFGKES